MSKKARSGHSQSRHDRKVREIARKYELKGYDVKADDVPDFSDPGSIHGKVPDVIAEKNGHTTVVEVETEDSVGTKRDKKQRREFKRWTGRKNTRHFKREVI
ncbi:hypothetical protein AKJ52_00470 [candidate division MSBL1 archaeon SCGC-AAA382C18]|uniref:REase AHJR-like domain-containing protein n=1 Tax=candidate division MSBL1 archaeon SCGC-AAA382C18 TaxID=1698281 RepID=A0A133VLI3_9EURY|nr:hypothetical protein AKJ52_00470 [candidate division MSBL1 archaeon SCGC-AAA382C18]